MYSLSLCGLYAAMYCTYCAKLPILPRNNQVEPRGLVNSWVSKAEHVKLLVWEKGNLSNYQQAKKFSLAL